VWAAAAVARRARADVNRALPRAGFRRATNLRLRLAEHDGWHERTTLAAAAAADAADALADWRAVAADTDPSAAADLVSWADAWRFALALREQAAAELAACRAALAEGAPSSVAPAVRHMPRPAPPARVHVVVDAFATLGERGQRDLLDRLAGADHLPPLVLLSTDARTAAWAASGGADTRVGGEGQLAMLYRRRRGNLRKAG
jgi:hypothetical protein